MFDNIIKELHEAHHEDKEKFLAECIQVRLNDSLQSYYKELLDSFNTLNCRNPYKIIKKLGKDK